VSLHLKESLQSLNEQLHLNYWWETTRKLSVENSGKGWQKMLDVSSQLCLKLQQEQTKWDCCEREIYRSV